MWDEITYPFPNFNGATVKVWEWITNLIFHFMMGVISNSDLLSMLVFKLQSSQKTFLATSPVGQVIDQAHLSETKSTCPVGLVAGNIH